MVQILPTNSCLIKLVRVMQRVRIMLGLEVTTASRLELLRKWITEYEKVCQARHPFTFSLLATKCRPGHLRGAWQVLGLPQATFSGPCHREFPKEGNESEHEYPCGGGFSAGGGRTIQENKREERRASGMAVLYLA